MVLANCYQGVRLIVNCSAIHRINGNGIVVCFNGLFEISRTGINQPQIEPGI